MLKICNVEIEVKMARFFTKYLADPVCMCSLATDCDYYAKFSMSWFQICYKRVKSENEI